MGAKTSTFYVGAQAPFANKNTSEEEKMFEGTSSRGSSSSDLTNVSQVNFALTWVTFQEIPATKIDFRCVRK